MAADDTPLKPQCDEALHEIYHLLAGEITDAKREQITGHLDDDCFADAVARVDVVRVVGADRVASSMRSNPSAA